MEHEALTNGNGYNHKITKQHARMKWNVGASVTARNTFNPIRAIVDGMKLTPNPDKKMIALSLGDPTVFGNFQPPKEAEQAIIDAVRKGTNNGYSPSFGHESARAAVASFVSTEGAIVNAGDVYLACGCSDAIQMAITVLASPGDNIIVPRPGFSLYKTLALSQGIGVKFYDCLPAMKWEADLEHMESLIDDRTRAIVVVNPSNPCGSNFSRTHIRDILSVAERNKVPIIADEIYSKIVFSGETFISCASESSNVPVLSCGGLAKTFLVPGWRLGWLVVHDRNQVFGKDIRSGLVQLSQRVLGPCTLVQAALPGILRTPQSFHNGTVAKIEINAKCLYERIKAIPGLKPIKPTAAMYMMVGFDRDRFPDIKDDVAFTERLVTEQSVFCLPAKCFEYPYYFRVVLTIPEDQTEEACGRLEEFCSKYYRTK